MSNHAEIISFELFERIYLEYLMAGDRPTCYVAYLRAESEVFRQFGAKRHKTYVSFRNVLCRHRRRRRLQKRTQNK